MISAETHMASRFPQQALFQIQKIFQKIILIITKMDQVTSLNKDKTKITMPNIINRFQA